MARATKLREKPRNGKEPAEKETQEEPKQLLNLNELRNRKSTELMKLARDLEIEETSRMTKQDLTYAILKAQSEKEGVIFAEGVLEILSEGYGFLRSPKYSYLPGPDDIYVSKSQIRSFNLKTGDTVGG